MLSLRLVIPLALLTLGQWAHGDVQCRDENNNPVDWYVFYKFPKLSDSSKPLLKKGNGYMFITSDSIDKGWQVSSNGIDEDSSLLARTLPFLNDSQKEILWFVYNDQGDDICLTCGHTKGVVAGDNSSGIWLVHSIPHFIDGTYPKTGYRFAQSALCISLSSDELNSVGDLLAYNTPNFRKWNIVNTLQSQYPKIIAAFQKVKVKSPWTLNKPITTLNGTQLQAFAKARKFNNDLYEWVAASLQTDLFVESWINDLRPLPSSCKIKYRVMNVKSMVIPQLDVEYSSHKEHSKLAISDSVSKPWICIGDINRAVSQEKRGGGTVCFNNAQLWHSYQALINSTENCSSFKCKLGPFRLSNEIPSGFK